MERLVPFSRDHHCNIGSVSNCGFAYRSSMLDRFNS
jgi:hypothetical protein